MKKQIGDEETNRRERTIFEGAVLAVHTATLSATHNVFVAVCVAVCFTGKGDEKTNRRQGTIFAIHTATLTATHNVFVAVCVAMCFTGKGDEKRKRR